MTQKRPKPRPRLRSGQVFFRGWKAIGLAVNLSPDVVRKTWHARRLPIWKEKGRVVTSRGELEAYAKEKVKAALASSDSPAELESQLKEYADERSETSLKDHQLEGRGVVLPLLLLALLGPVLLILAAPGFLAHLGPAMIAKKISYNPRYPALTTAPN